MKKTNILFDATIFTLSYSYRGFRTGIYFVAYNILKELVKDKRYVIYFYVQDCIHQIHNFKNDKLLSGFRVYISNNDIQKNNIKNHINSILYNNSPIKMIILFLKIVKNVFKIYITNKKKEKIFKNTNIFFSPLYTSTSEINKYKNIKKYFVLYDTMPLNFPDYFPDLSSEDYWFNKLTKDFSKNNNYFCISKSTKNDFLKYFRNKLDENKMIVSYIGPAQEFYPFYNKELLLSILYKYNIQFDINKNFIFSFCTIEPRKNLLFTVICFIKFIKKHNINDLYFFLGGSQWDFFINQLEEKVNNFNEYKEKILRLGYVDDADVNILYSNSLFFVFISQYEGFGLPALEAMKAGTPVITSNNSSLPEVVGDSAITITYNNENECIKAFENLYFNEELRIKYIDKGIERAKLFSWENTVNIMKNEFKTK